MGKLTLAVAWGLTLAFCFSFAGCGATGFRVSLSGERIDSYTETRSAFNSTAADFWNGMFGEKKEGK